MSEVILEQSFSKMKLIMTSKHTHLNDKSLDALMGISFQSEALVQHQIKVIIGEWENCVWHIFEEST